MKIQGFDYSENLEQSILWQYDNASNLKSLIEKKQAWFNKNQSEFWSNWQTDVFDLRTANFFGLSVWSYILNLPLFIPVNPDPPGKPIFGFNAYDPAFPDLLNTYKNFNNGTFSSRRAGDIALTLEQQRFILRLRYFQLVTSGAVFEINEFLNYLMSTSTNLMPTGTLWALDGLDMSMVYVFGFNPPINLRQVLVKYDLLPRPAGVKLRYVISTGAIFGFGQYYRNFNNGCFHDNFL